MAKYRRKPALTEATQWFKNGDHPDDNAKLIDTPDGPQRTSEGLIVRHFRSLTIPGGRFCPDCGNVMQKHGEIINEINGETEIVCPGDYIVTDSKGRRYRMPAVEFEAMFEPYSPAAH